MDVVVVVDGGMVEALQTAPLLRTLSLHIPRPHTILACPPAALPITAGLLGVAEAIPLRLLGGARDPKAFGETWTTLRSRRLSHALLCTRSPACRAAVYASAIPRRAGVAGGLTTITLTDAIKAPGGENRAASWLRLAAACDVDETVHDGAFEPGPRARGVASERLVGGGIDDGHPLVAIAPGDGADDPGTASTAGTRWEPERYAHLANQLNRRHGASFVIVGTEADRIVADEMRLDLDAPSLDVSGELTPLETAAVIGRCGLFIGGDSPLLHLAAVMGTPAVGLFGPTDGHLRGPYGDGDRVVQALSPPRANGRTPKGARASIDAIRVEDVLAAIESQQ